MSNMTFKNSLKIICDKCNLNYDYWVTRKNIDPYFDKFIEKVSNCKLNDINNVKNDIDYNFDKAIKLICDKANMNYLYWYNKQSIQKYFEALVNKIAKCLM